MLLCVIAVGCAASSRPAPKPGTAQAGLSGTECAAEDHSQPFIISWDAIDQSRLEVAAAKQIVFVRYEGCSLALLDGCSLESGSYLEPEWAPGKLTTVDIRTQPQLVDVLPLAASMLGARVSRGESFHLEYFIAGTRRAHKDTVSRSEVAARDGCDGATHFVHALDLGAFALTSAKNLEVGAHRSAGGAEVGGRLSRSQSFQRNSGDLSTCNTEDPEAAMQCRAPIRLTLRELE